MVKFNLRFIYLFFYITELELDSSFFYGGEEGERFIVVT